MARVKVDEKKVMNTIRKAMRTRGTIVGEFLEGAAKLRCPVDTGNLRSSITHRVMIKADTITIRVGTSVDYAPYVELGTRHQAAQPFLRRALLESRAQIQQILNL